MAEQSKPNTFGGGMVTDLDPGYQPKDTYFTGLNIRVITNGDNSYSLENIKGPKLEWNLNTHSDGVYYTGTNRYVIHGAVVVDDYVITIEGKLVSSDKTWKIRKYTIDHQGDLSIDGSLDVSLWSGTGLFSDDAGEIEMESSVETDTVHRVYCTDGITSLKSINVKESISSNDVTDFTAFKPEVGAQASIGNYSDTGGKLLCGSYSYVYRLASKNQANWSDWSSISSPINIVQGDLSSMDSLFIEGDTSSNFSTSTITVNIIDIPTEYEIIEVAAIHYVTNNSNTVSLIEQGDLDGTSYSFIHSGFETETLISGGIADVLISNLTWDSCKTLAQKDNKLYAGNLTSSLMDLDLSSYRVKSYQWVYANGSWNSFTHADVHNPNRHYNGSGSNNSYSISNDAADKNVLKFINKNFNSDNTSQGQPKFVLGAETPGYSSGGDGYRITFTNESYIIDDRWSMTVSGTVDTGMSAWLNGQNPDYYANHKARPFRVGSEYNDNAYGGGKPGPSNPLWDNEFRGFKRGECYRFGIVCFDLKGVPGFVHHIGDIKMPDAMDPNNLVLNSAANDTEINFTEDTNVNYLTNNLNKGWQPVTSRGKDYNKTWAHALIPRVEVRFPDSIKNQISGYKIVKVEMLENDRMVMTQGLLNPIMRYKNDSNTPTDMKNKVGVGYVPHNLNKSDTDGSNATWAAGAMEQYGYTLDTPDATFGGLPLSYGSGFDLKVIYPVEMDMGGLNWYQDESGESIGYSADPSVTNNEGVQGKSELWGENTTFNYSSSANNNVQRLLDTRQDWSGMSFNSGGATNDPYVSGINIRGTGTYISYKYRPVKIMEDLDKFLSYSDEKLLNGVRRQLKFTKAVVNGEEVGTSSSGMSYIFRNSSVQSQSASGNHDWVNSGSYIANSSGIDHATTGEMNHCPTTMFVSTHPDNIPMPSVVKVDNATSATIPDDHWFGHMDHGAVHGTKLWRWNTSKWICEVIRHTADGWEQFGGVSDGAIRNNRFISASPFKKKTTTDFLITEGDVYVDYYSIGKSLQGGSASTQSYGQTFPIESRYNIALRQGVYLGSSDVANFNVEDNYLYNTAYSMQNSLKGYVAKPNDFTSNDFFRAKIAASQTKLVGEPFDAWSVFPSSDFIELNLAQGKLTDLVNYKNNLYALQDQGVSLLSINPRALITAEGSAADIQIVSGTGTAIERYDYLTTQYGSQHFNKAVTTPTGFYFIDSDKGELIKFDGNTINPASLSLGYKSYIESITKDKIIPINSNNNIGSLIQGIYCGYDSEFRECHFTISDSTNTINSFVISDLDAKLVTKLELKSDATTSSFGSIFFKKYISYKNRLYGVGHETSSNSNDSIYLFNSDVYQNFNVGFVANDNAIINKIFDSSEIITDVQNTTDKFSAHLLEDSIGNNSSAGGALERIREGIHRLPLRGSSDTHRMRGNWLKHTIHYYQPLVSNSIDSANDKKFNIFAINTRYRQSR